MTYVSNAAVVVVKIQDGSDRYAYMGAPIPEDVDPATVKALLAEGLIVKADQPDKSSK